MSTPVSLAQVDAAPDFRLVLPERAPGIDAPAFAGRLDHVSLPSLLLVLEAERKTGILTLDLEPGCGSATLSLREGRVVRAHLSGRQERRHAAAVDDLLDCTRGAFEFLPDPEVQGDDIGCSTTQLLVDGARRRSAASASAAPGTRLRKRNRRRILRGVPGPFAGGESRKDVMACFFMACVVLLLLLTAVRSGPRPPDSPAHGSLERKAFRPPGQP